MTDIQPAPGTIATLDLLRGAPSATALLVGDEAIDYAGLRDRVASRTRELGGGRRLVLITGANELEPIVTYLAALAGGHVALLATPEHAAALRDRYDPDLELTSGPSGWTLDERRSGSRHRLHPELALLLSTSGSTGSPKLVRLSHANLESNAESIADYLALTPADRAASSLPLHYCYGLSVLNSHLVAGASVRVTDRSVVDAGFWEDFTASGCTSFAGVPHTFDLLDSSGFWDRRLPGLRYITQAGGRLAPERVRRYARLGRERGVDLVVMYGQTEATARMAYLPPGLAEAHPESIGIAIPGGELTIVSPDENGVGELVYRGPNVMLGYAESPTELALGRTVTELRTGDLGRWLEGGLVEIVGRRNRFAKVFGLRIDLTRVEAILEQEGIESRAVDLDGRVGVAVRDAWAEALVAPVLRSALDLPGHAIRTRLVEDFPRTSSGKPDSVALVRQWPQQDPGERPGHESARTADGIRSLYAEILERPDATPDDSFASLQGDSLSYVEVSLRLQQLLGTLPEDWPSRSARDLARAPVQLRVQTVAAQRWARVETAIMLRTIGISIIVATHANLLDIQGGAHLLLAILGFNLARFQLADIPRRARAANLLRAAGHIVVPAVLWIGGVALVTGMYRPTTVLLLNSALGADDGWTVQWQFWFLEAAVWGVLGLAVIAAIPLIDRLERRRPFAVAAGVLAAALALRLALTGGIEAEATARYSAPVLVWLLALGWLIARSTTTSRRIASSAAAVVAVAGFLGDPGREAVVVGGLLLLTWVPAIPLPRLLVPAIRVVAASSLFVYLVHWQVYPALEVEYPVLATAASFAAGILVWLGYRALARATSRTTRRLVARRGRSRHS